LDIVINLNRQGLQVRGKEVLGAIALALFGSSDGTLKSVLGSISKAWMRSQDGLDKIFSNLIDAQSFLRDYHEGKWAKYLEYIGDDIDDNELNLLPLVNALSVGITVFEVQRWDGGIVRVNVWRLRPIRTEEDLLPHFALMYSDSDSFYAPKWLGD
jgi:hypothetical protein